jgi:phage gp29-like protein
MILDRNGNPIVAKPPETGDIATQVLVDGLIAASDLMPNPSKTLKTIGKIIDAFDQTLAQPDVAAASGNFHDGIKALSWDLSQSTEQGPRVAWLKEVLGKLDVTEACSSFVTAREYGYTICEVMWYKDGSKILPYAIVEKPRKWFRFDKSRRLRMITQKNPEGILIDEVYPRKFLLVQHRPTYLNPYGKGLLDIMYWYVQGLYSNFEWHLKFLEDDGADHWIAYVNKDAGQEYINTVHNAIATLRRRGVCVLYDGVRAEQRENKGRKSSSDVYKAFEEMVISKINKLWLGTDLSMQNNDVGARASSETGATIRGEALASGKKLAESAMNTLIRWILELNSAPGSDSELINFSLSKTALTTKEQAEIDKSYAEAAGGKVSDQLLIRRGYEPGDFDRTSPDTTSAKTATVFADGGGYGNGLSRLLDATEAAKKKP